MERSDLLILIIGTPLVFIFRIFPRLLQPNKITIDTWYHLSSSYSFIKNNFRIFDKNYGYILGGKYDYPYLAHLIIAFICRNKKNLLRFEKFISPAIDAIYFWIAYIYCIFLFKYYHLELNLTKKIFFVLLFTTSSTMLKISTGPRVYSFTPRIFGELFTFISFISLHLFFIYHKFILFFISVLFTSFVFLTSKFSSQVIILTLLLLTVLLRKIFPFCIIIISVFTAIVISKRHFLKIAKSSLIHISHYMKVGQFQNPHVRDRNNINKYIFFFQCILRLKKCSLKEIYSIFISDLTFLNVFYKDFEILLSFFLLIHKNSFFDFYIKQLYFSLFAIFIITSFKPFLFLGESDRYLEHLVVFSFIILIFYSYNNEALLYFVIIVNILLYLISVIIYIKSSNDFGKDFLEAMEFIQSEYKKGVVHGELGTMINYPLSFLTELPSLAIEANYVFELLKDKNLMPKYGTYTRDWEYLHKKYGVNVIVVNKKKFTLNGINANFCKVFENNSYVIFSKQ